MRCIVLGLVAQLALLPAIATASSSIPPAATIPVVLHMDGRISVSVRVNGVGPFRFRLDTGSSRTVVGARLALRLGATSAGESRTITQTGETRRRLVRLDELALGDTLAVRDVVALTVDDRELDRTGLLDGLLGQDVLSHWAFTIDYEAGRLTLAARTGGTPAGTVRLPLSQVSGGLVALVPREGGAAPLRLVPDSGADRLVLFRSRGRALPPVTLLEMVRVRSIVGDGIARLVRVEHLDVGGIRLHGTEGLLMDRDPGTTAMGDGLLPLHLFARATFDLAEGHLLLEPRR